MKNFLVKENADYADEFSVSSFKIVKANSEKEIIDKIETEHNSKYPMSFCFGTNEDVIIDSREELEDVLDFQEISDEDVKVFERFFPNITKYAFGTNAIL